jgi:hypothetical protein
VEEVITGGVVVVAAGVVWEVVAERAPRELVREEVDLVQEEDDRRLDEPAAVRDRVEERQRLLHPVLHAGHLSDGRRGDAAQARTTDSSS